jgi:hypothetical protein
LAVGIESRIGLMGNLHPAMRSSQKLNHFDPEPKLEQVESLEAVQVLVERGGDN